ncbi:MULTISPECIES: hypothetical protein [Cupriavidus]|uniref:hypothetical protein n=1 Tax=Cupriavidus sp. DF5525 TaxID=3160989 RepID=UPI0003B0D881|nr:hypothetical protein N234_16120 [Ralstonia pickettii DTP0602]
MQAALPRLPFARELTLTPSFSFAGDLAGELVRFPPTALRKPIAALIRTIFGGLARPWRQAPGWRADSDALLILGHGTRMRALSWAQWHPDHHRAAPLPAPAGRPGNHP